VTNDRAAIQLAIVSLTELCLFRLYALAWPLANTFSARAQDKASIAKGCAGLPAGVFKSGGLLLKPHTTLYVSAGAILRASTNGSDFMSQMATVGLSSYVRGHLIGESEAHHWPYGRRLGAPGTAHCDVNVYGDWRMPNNDVRRNRIGLQTAFSPFVRCIMYVLIDHCTGTRHMQFDERAD
jgi:hypothetical protein